MEHVAVDFDGEILADGVVVGVADNDPVRIRYCVQCDEQGIVRSVRIDPLGNGDELVLEHDGAGTWADDSGEPQPALSGCLDVDISVTPFTNTIPIRRLGLAADETATIRVAYLDAVAMTASAAEQRYTCLEPLDESGGRFVYESLTSGFTSTLPVDSSGVVRDYPGVFRRLEP